MNSWIITALIVWPLVVAASFYQAIKINSKDPYLNILTTKTVLNSPSKEFFPTKLPEPALNSRPLDGFYPSKGVNATVFSDNERTNAALIIDGISGVVHTKNGLVSSMYYSADGFPIINEHGEWIGQNSGLKGDTGISGSKGDRGDTGIQGIQGSPGINGASGIQGLKGDKGDSAPKCSEDSDCIRNVIDQIKKDNKISEYLRLGRIVAEASNKEAMIGKSCVGKNYAYVWWVDVGLNGYIAKHDVCWDCVAKDTALSARCDRSGGPQP